jgi:hypothetical protein
VTDQNPPHQPPGGEGSREPWKQPSNPWHQPTDTPGGGPDQSDEKTQLAWSGSASGGNAPSGPQPPMPAPGGGQQWGTGPQPGADQPWPPPPAAGGAPAWPQPGADQQHWGQPGADQQHWAQQGGSQQGGGQQNWAPQGGWQQGGGTSPYQGGTGHQTPGSYQGGPEYYQQNPQGGYPPPGTGYPPPGGWQQPPPPQPPQQQRRNPLMIIVPLAVVVAILIGVVIALAVGGDDNSDNLTAPNPAPSLSLPGVPGAGVADPSTPTPTPSPTRTGPAGVTGCVPVTPLGAPAGTAGIGGSGTVVGEAHSSVSDFQAKLTLNSVCSTTGKVTTYGSPPTQGAYYVLNVTVEVSRGDTSASPSAFYIQTPDGTRYDGSYTSVEPRLSASTVKAGQKVRGNIVIDAPPGHGVLNWEPLFAVTPAKFQL